MEWCEDEWSEQLYSLDVAPGEPLHAPVQASGEAGVHVVRGGSYRFGPDEARISIRRGASTPRTDIGLRVARDVDA